MVCVNIIPSRNSDPGSHSSIAGSSPPLPTRVRALHFYLGVNRRKHFWRSVSGRKMFRRLLRRRMAKKNKEKKSTAFFVDFFYSGLFGSLFFLFSQA